MVDFVPQEIDNTGFFISHINGEYYENEKINPKDLAVTKRPSNEWIWVTDHWEPDYTALKERKATELAEDLKKSIEGGFVSNALGQNNHYAGDMDTQISLIGAVVSGVPQNFTVRAGSASGARSRPSHTPAQLTNVLNDGAVFKESKIAQYDSLLIDIDNIIAGAGTDEEKVAAIEAVVWV